MHKCVLVSICTEIKGCCWLCLTDSVISYLSIFLFAFLISESILFFHDFPWPSLQFYDFLCLEIEIINSMTFQAEVTTHNNYSMTLTPNTTYKKYGECICMYTRRRHGICLIWQITLLSTMENAWHMNGTIKTCNQKVCFFLYLVNKVKSNTSVKTTTTKKENY